MKKRLLAAMLTMAMTMSTSGVVCHAENGIDYDVENHEFNDVTITLHTRWDEADVSGPLYMEMVNSFMENIQVLLLKQLISQQNPSGQIHNLY